MTVVDDSPHIGRNAVLDHWRDRLRGWGLTVALPDGSDPRVLHAADRLHREGIVCPQLYGNADTIRAAAAQHDLHLPPTAIVDVRESATDPAIHTALQAGFSRHTDHPETMKTDPTVVAAAALRAGQVDACVAGATRPTADVLRVGLRVVGLTAGVRTLSSCFLMLLADGRQLTFSDCAVVPDPSSEQLADIATAASNTHRALSGDDPIVAMLSFSTQRSANHSRIDTVREATQHVRHQQPHLRIDGELQLDAALVESTAATKAPHSSVAGQANVLVFPNLDAGNIGYKIAERLGGAVALGPILQGLAAPINDLSRGCSSSDIEEIVLLSAIQAIT